MIRFTTFTNTFDVLPTDHTAADWSAFADYLEVQSRVHGNPARKRRTLCVCPAVYVEPHRGKRNVASWDWFAADIDNKAGNQLGSTMLDIVEKCEAMGLSFVIYTTTSSRDKAQCFRLMLPLSRTVAANEFAQFWGSMATWLGCVDQQTKDESRLFVAPRKWAGADNHFIRFDDGDVVDVDTMMLAYPVSAPAKASRALKRQFALPAGLKPLSTPLDLDSEFVTADAYAKATQGEQGGRLYGLLCSVATRAMRRGNAVTVEDLTGLARQLASRLNRHTEDITHDATNALAFAIDAYADRKAQSFNRIAPTIPSRWIKK